jgi:hypothetical protein
MYTSLKWPLSSTQKSPHLFTVLVTQVLPVNGIHCLIALARNSKTMLNKTGESDTLVSLLTLEGTFSVFSYLV